MLRNTGQCRFAALETAKAQVETRLQSALAERDAAVQARQAAEASANALQQQLQVRTEIKISRILSRTPDA